MTSTADVFVCSMNKHSARDKGKYGAMKIKFHLTESIFTAPFTLAKFQVLEHHVVRGCHTEQPNSLHEGKEVGLEWLNSSHLRVPLLKYLLKNNLT